MSDDDKINIKAPEAIEEEPTETLEDVIAERKKNSRKRMTKEQYAEAKAMWLTGDYTLKVLAQRYNVTPNNLHLRFKKDGVIKGAGRDLHQRAAQKALSQKLADDLKKHSQMAMSTRNRALQGVEVISKLRGNIIASQVKSNRPISEIYDDVKTLNEASKGMRNDWDAVKFILDLDKKAETDDELPQLTFRAMDEKDIQKINDEKKAELDELGDLEIDEIVPNTDEDMDK